MPGSAPETLAPDVAAVVLAGGRGSRMGGVDKGLVAYNGRPLVEWVLDALRQQADPLLISANRNLERYRTYGVAVVTDTLPDYPGPLAGVLAALDATDSTWLAVTPCDTPHLPRDCVARLLAAACAADVPLAVAADDTRTHYTTFLVRASERAALAAFLASGRRAVRDWMAGTPHVVVRFDTAAFVNVNRLPGAVRPG